MKGQGLRIDSVNAIGGISKKAPFVMQTLADVLDMPIRVVRSEQTCALGAAMFAAVAQGCTRISMKRQGTWGRTSKLNTGRMKKEPSSTKNYTRNILNWQKLAETIN